MSGGKLSPNTKLLNNPYGYNGEYHDLESGFQYLRARYYNPETARFITRDSYLGDINEPLTLNRYAYTANNPVKYKDPSGNVPESSSDDIVQQNQIDEAYLRGKSDSSVKNQPLLKYGSRGDSVVKVQSILDELGYDFGPSGVDGVYGYYTQEAMKSYQTANGLKSDGIVGPETWGSFNGYVNKKAAESRDRSNNSNACDDLGGGIASGNGALGTGNDNDLPLGIGFVKSSPTNTTIEIKNLPEEITRTQIKQKASEMQPKGPGGNLFILAFLTTWNIVNEGNQLDADPWEIAIDESQEALKKYKALPDSKVTTNKKGETLIYHTATGTVASMTPRPLPKLDTVGVDSTGYKRGLSFQFTKPIGEPYYVTTLEAVNSTGTLVALPDDFDHISVRPVVDDGNYSKLKEWASTRPLATADDDYKGHPYTQKLFDIGTFYTKYGVQKKIR